MLSLRTEPFNFTEDNLHYPSTEMSTPRLHDYHATICFWLSAICMCKHESRRGRTRETARGKTENWESWKIGPSMAIDDGFRYQIWAIFINIYLTLLINGDTNLCRWLTDAPQNDDRQLTLLLSFLHRFYSLFRALCGQALGGERARENVQNEKRRSINTEWNSIFDSPGSSVRCCVESSENARGKTMRKEEK